MPSSPALPSCSERAQCCCPCWLLSSSQSTMPSTSGTAATRSTTTAHRVTYTVRRVDPARARSLYWRTAAYNPTEEGDGQRTPNPLTIASPNAHVQSTFYIRWHHCPRRMSCGNWCRYYKCVTWPTGIWPWPWGTGSGAKDILPCTSEGNASWLSCVSIQTWWRVS